MTQPRHHGVRHLAIIMDGNRRWAKKQGLPPYQGHAEGYRTLKKIGDAVISRQISFLTVYAFSQENWKRSKRDVDFLLGFIDKVLQEEVGEFHQKNMRLLVTGRVEELPRRSQKFIKDAVRLTSQNTAGTLNILLNYGGREEIVDAVRSIVLSKLKPEAVTIDRISQSMYRPELPDPDLIIRTSGEHRLSGLLPWQSVYSELYFSPKLWPDFSEADLDDALREFSRRQRRFGT